MSGQSASNSAGWLWQPGQSGNPKGRPSTKLDLPAICRTHTAKAVKVLVQLLDDDDGRLRLGAARELLDRGYGRPVTPIATNDSGDSLQVLHLLAAQHVASLMQQKLAAAPDQTPESVVIDYSQPALE